ncbi:uncharacterized protein PAC_07523 [Phialocephala subalpina]|uniref:Uncharacterized protein n=1 Tax=Phialocephala subalpina TaxID=576137 RepID=A0A1L7WXZ6_9HELO|nr:uncharacterized protein PAC_07523 [Phialocephala subalpina]
MDGISAASAVVQVLGASLVLSQKIASFILDAKDVAETRSRLFDQVECLYNTVLAVNVMLKRREAQLSTRLVSDDEREIYVQTKTTLEKTQRSVQWLEKVLEKLGGGRTRMCWEKAWLQMKFQVRNPAIAKISRQIETSVSSLQLMLQCINLFVHDETQAVVQTGFDTTKAFIIQTHALMAELKSLVQQSVHGSEAEIIQSEEEKKVAVPEAELGLNSDDIEDQATDMASECLSTASSLCGKISQPGTNIRSARQTTIDSDELRNLDALETILRANHISSSYTPTSQGNLSRRATGSLPMVTTRDSKAKDSKTTAVERFEILTGHIDNDMQMAVTALNEGNYSTAQVRIIGAIETAKEREQVHNFPFEDELAFREILAFAKAKNMEFEEAKHDYESLLQDAQATPCGKDTRGRLCYAVALVYRDEYEYCQEHMGEKDDKLFEVWKNYALWAYDSAMKRPGRPDSVAPWKTHPSLTQAGELLSQMFEYWGEPGKAMTYRQRHPSQSDPKTATSISISDPATMRGPLRDLVPPTPPDSDGQVERAVSQSAEDSVLLGTNLEDLHKSSSTASGLLVLHKIEQNDYETTKWFLDLAEGSVDMEQRNERGLTPLLLAVQKRHTKIVRLLLEHGKSPDVTAKDKNGWTVLHYALSGPEGEDMVELLVAHGADVNAAANDGTTPLHCAVLNNKLHGAEILLKNHVSTEARDTAGRTPMYVAVQKKRHEMVDLLVGGGAVCDRTAWNKPEMKRFFEECEDMGILQPIPPDQVPTPRRESVFSTISKNPIFGKSRNSISS